ncbi:NAD(P)/FAD-dependent oxidoreductase [Amphritea japonica]|uniref:FAD-dependent oxidoreductase n=1 Tax=Amphritea japonica ATCC BAA-1530 TaxID=1278309 RepID=A0A7R6P4E7_9GAMM|nr:FAD-dependent oxidoreductase [Amphritea japonica]BBB26914.1 FAD-dependent oxidoreductase [Amphritea japonica ATCC BAA-1530]
MTESVRINRGSSDVAVIGGGLVGLCIALGIQKQGQQVTVYDEGDVALRASRGNFGLVWVQGKGDNLPEYARITRLSARLWDGLADDLTQHTGIDIQLQQRGGLFVCLNEAELQKRQEMLQQMAVEHSEGYPYEVLDLQQLREMIPDIGPEIAGATWGPEDGHVNPLYLMQALVARFESLGGKLVNAGRVGNIVPQQGQFILQTAQGEFSCNKVVLAAGLGNKDLGPMVGIEAPVFPNRGQVLIAERVRPFLHYPTGHVRQTEEGTVQCGDSKEDVGFDTGTTTEVLAQIAHRATTMFPLLKEVNLIRSWGALRIMTPDGNPIYQQSEQYPGAYLVTCHSGVTLAAAHAGPVADWIVTGSADSAIDLEKFHGSRFKL